MHDALPDGLGKDCRTIETPCAGCTQRDARPTMPPEHVKKSRYLSWLLRHGAREQGVQLDEAGWASLDDVLRLSGLPRVAIDEIVREDPKHRLQVEAGRIRACQGHTPASGVTAAALEASWQPYTSDAPVWHGTNIEAAEQIAREGILPIDRTHVHCAPAPDSIVGRRANVHLLLRIDPGKMTEAGLRLYVAPNGVILGRRIPPEAISGLVPLTRRARNEAAALRAAFGLPPEEDQAPTAAQRGRARPTPEDRPGSASDPR